ncbi:hypothetical protein [Agromyces allii]|uniref:DUF222 domain-containing protein n=1 Tax=Agromyces allii TaxID=393607 RepID=A0ABN2Q382_9MICO|nr:hypothetical protein [Agromyces allii]
MDLITEYVNANGDDDREITLERCRIAFEAVGRLTGAPRNEAAKIFAEQTTRALADQRFDELTQPEEHANAMRTSVVSGGTRITHIAVTQRAAAWAIASVAGRPTVRSIGPAMRLATYTARGVASHRDALIAGPTLTVDELEEQVDRIIAAHPTVASITADDVLGWLGANLHKVGASTLDAFGEKVRAEVERRERA